MTARAPLFTESPAWEPAPLPEPCNHAPVLHAMSVDPVSRRLMGAYNQWREHYERCRVCNVNSWWDPDPAACCTAGRAHFAGWLRLAMASVPTKGGAVAASPLRMRTFTDTEGTE